MKRVLEEDEKQITEAEELYLKGNYKSAYDLYWKIIQKNNLVNANDEDGILQRAANVFDKLSSYTPQEEQNYNKILEALIGKPENFPDNISDRICLLQKKPSLFYQKYYEYISTHPSIAHKMLAAISIVTYFDIETPDPNQNYLRFIGKEVSAKQFLAFDSLINLEANSLGSALKQLNYFGLSNQALQIHNGWGDTLAHRGLYWGNPDKALIYLKYAEKCSTSFLNDYLYSKKNHQRENWLDDIARRTIQDDAVKTFTDFLAHKKLHYFTLFKDMGNTYLQVAASSDNSDFVYEILSSIKQQSEKMGLEQRIFNLEALKLSQFYKSHDKLMELLRHLGASEYRAQGDYEEAYTKDNQNVHRAEFTNPLLEAVKKLEKHYNSNANFIETQCIEFERFFHSLIQEIGKREDLRKGRSEEDYLLDFLERYKCSVLRVKATDSDSVNKKIFYLKEFLKGAEITVSRIIDSQSFTNAYEREINAIAKNNNFPQTNTVHDHYTLKHALAFTWAGLKDPSAMAERKIDDLEVFERKLLLIVTLYETYQEGIEDSLKQNKGEIESISSEESLDIPYEKQEISQLARGDSNLPLKTKVDGLICYTGLFDRIITRLDAQHKLVNIDNVKPPVISVSDDLIKTFFKDWEKDLLHKVPITLLAKIYDNFEVLKKANLSVKFIPLQQYITGIFKKAFIEYVELGYFGNLENGLQSRDFEIIEDTIKRTSLINPIREALDFIQKKGMPNSYFHLLALKIYITSEIENAPILHSLRLIEKQKDFINNLPDFEDISPIFKIALLIRNSELLKGSKNLVLDLENYKLIKKTSESLQEELQRKASCDEVEGDQEVIKAIRSIAKKPQLDILDILKLQLITSNYLYESYSLTKLFKLAVEYDNHFMLKLIINNAESLYERDIALNKTFKSPIDYRNKYLDKVACKNFYKGLTILHIAAIHCKSNETFDLLFYYREFRDKIDFQDDQGCTPFFTASFIGNEIAINKLIEYGADANILNNNGDSPLHFIVRHFNSKFINKLFEKGMSPFAIDNESRTFIHSLAQATKNSVTNDKDYVTFKEGLLKNIPISNDILPYFDGTVKAIFEAMDTESTSVEAKHFPVHTYEQELNDYLESKDKFIEEYRSGHLDITSLTKDSIYSLLLNTAIVLQNAKAVKSILKMTHNENIFTYIDDTGYSPISHALDYADENILTLLKDYIKTHKDSIKKLTNMDQQEKDNFLNILTYFKYDKLDPKECLNEYLLPLYTEEALTSDIIGLIDELEEHIGHYY